MPAALPASLKVIDLSSNYLEGTFPTTTATSVACASNCLQDASKCLAGSAQRAAGACAICETPNATGRMCGGGICTPNATALIAANTNNADTASLYCLGATMDPVMAAALLNMRASLGVTFTDWALDSPCTIQGLAPLPGAWSNVVCNVSGKVMSLNLAQQKLQGSMHADISKLTALTYINLRTNLLEGHLDVFTTNFKALTALKEAYLDFNWFTGPIPSTLVSIATLSTFGASYNYLYGAMPTPGAALKAIALDGNWLSGTFPGAGFSSCSATANCLTSIGACTTGGTVQRDAVACPVCDKLDGSGTVCGGGTCAPDTTGPLASSTPNSATAAVLPRFCVGVPLDATQGNILLALKTTLGVTFSDWTASTLAAPKATSPKPKTGKKPKGGSKRRTLQGRGSGLLYDWKAVGSCTIVGQTPIAGSWTGVRCSPLGQIVGLDLRSQLLSGTVHSDISKLSTLTSLRLSSNLFFNRLDSYIVPITPAATLKEVSVPPRLRPSMIHPARPPTIISALCSHVPSLLHFRSLLSTQAQNIESSCVNNAPCPCVCMCVRAPSSLSPPASSTSIGSTAPSPPRLSTCQPSPSCKPLALYLPPPNFSSPTTCLPHPSHPLPFFIPLQAPLHASVPNTPRLLPVHATPSVVSNNYLTGTLPKPAATLKGLDTEYNFLSGTFPAASLAFCSARGNCFLDATACVNIDGTAQRGAGCNVCASPKGQLPLCGGAVCTPDPSAYVASKVPNSATAPTLALKCPAFPLDAATSAALVNIGAALGVTHSDWSTNSVCNILGQNVAPKSWPGVWCSGSGAVTML
ncbi:unnamed protein product [Closterium sp. Naga37s-1]|nr:unnamed protein product [Closterium sp. Naga37s-1]